MFEDENVIEFCINHKISFTQFAFCYFLLKKDFSRPFHESQSKRYVNKFGMFEDREVKDLIDRGFVLDLNSPGDNRPEFYVVEDKFIQALYSDENQGEQLWRRYPHSFHVEGKDESFTFGARHASVYQTKESLIDAYLKKIKRSKKKHDFVMNMLDEYVNLVRKNKINSMKLGDWVANEVWDIVNDLKSKDKEVTFGKDI